MNKRNAVFNKGKIEAAVQVCYEINQDNLKREIDGPVAALGYFDLKNGSIITFNQEDVHTVDDMEIKLIPLSQLIK